MWKIKIFVWNLTSRYYTQHHRRPLNRCTMVLFDLIGFVGSPRSQLPKLGGNPKPTTLKWNIIDVCLKSPLVNDLYNLITPTYSTSF